MQAKPKEAREDRRARTRVSGPTAAHPSREERQGSLLSSQNQILSKIATGCTIPELMSDVADYVKTFAPTWDTAVHLVDPSTGRLTRGISKSLGRAVIQEMERIPLSEEWPVGTAFATGNRWRRSEAESERNESYLELEKKHDVQCFWVAPARSSKGATVAVVTAFRRTGCTARTARTEFEESLETVLDVASSILGMGVERIRTVERLLLAKSSIDKSREPTLCVRSDASFIYVNDAACEAFGYARDELLAMHVWELDANVSEEDFQRIWELTARRDALVLRTEVRLRDGGATPVEIAISHIKIQNEGFQCAVIHNISALRETEKRLHDCEERYALAAKGANDGLWSWDLDRDAMHLSPRWCALVGLEPEERHASPEEWWRRIHPDDVERVRAELDAHLSGKSETFEIEHRMVHNQGRYLWVLTRGEAVRDVHGAPARIAGSLTDITKQKLAEERLRHDALHDDLTGLPNRSMFMDHFGRVLERARRSEQTFQFAVLFLDFDRFKRINDSLGHLVGDQLLIAIARRLGSCVRPSDTVARLGGDEFAVLLERVAGVTGATRLAERVHQALREPFRVSGLEVFITASIGIAVASRTYERPEDILRDADTAMYRAKAAGKARHEVFDEAMHARAIEQLKLEVELGLAVKRKEFCLRYQPVVSLEDGRPVGVEAFARWQHPNRGLLAPVSFLSVAEESGLIVDIGWWIFREACTQMKAWQDRFQSARSLAIHVNLSGKELFQPELPERIEAVLAETGLKPEHLVLDIPENVIMHKAESSVTILGQLKSLALRIHLDDFGTGYSSLGYLHRFQIDTLKIDHSFIRHLRSGGENWKTVRAIVSLAKNLGMDVIAEGVESEEQFEQLRKLRCKSAQGSFFEEPLTDDEMARFLSRPDASGKSPHQK